MTESKHQQALAAISETMKTFYGSDYSLCEAINRIESIHDDLCEIIWEVRARDNDYRIGEDVYGYDSPESILLNLQYISDRWNVAYRLGWLLGLVNTDFGPGSAAIRALERNE
jgi:hypothetical protein